MQSILSIQILRWFLTGVVLTMCPNADLCFAFCAAPVEFLTPSDEREVEIEDEKQFEDLVFQLDEANSKSERDKIVSKIKSQIATAVHNESLTNILSNPPRGIRNQTRLLLLQIKKEIEQTRNAAAIKSTPITIAGSYSLHDVLDKLKEQTKVEFKLAFQPNDVRKDFSLTDVPYWEAFDQILDSYQVSVSELATNSAAKANTIVIKKRISDEANRVASANYFGIVRGEVKSIRSIRNLNTPSLNVDRFSVQFAWEPSFQPYKFGLNMANIRATDSNGKELKIASLEKQSFNIPVGKRDVELQIPLRPIDRKADSLQSMSGTIDLAIPVGIERFEFSDLQNQEMAKVNRKANTVLTLESFTKELAKSNANDKSLYSAKISYAVSDSNGAFESHNGWMFRRQVFVLDENATVISPTKSLTTSQESNKIGFEFLFELPNGPQGCKFVYVTPTSIRNVQIKFDFRDIELR